MPKEREKEAEEVEKPQQKSGGKGLLTAIIILLLVVIAALVFVGVKVVLPIMSSKDSADASGQMYPPTMGQGGMQQGMQKEDPNPGPVIVYPPFLVNLSEPGGNRYIKLSLSIELSKEKNFQNEVVAKEPRIKDAIISIISSKTYDEISTHQGKIALKQEMIRKLNTIMSGGRIVDIYFTEFLIQ